MFVAAGLLLRFYSEARPGQAGQIAFGPGRGGARAATDSAAQLEAYGSWAGI